eukprot:2784527-Rhodomonas_salina.1
MLRARTCATHLSRASQPTAQTHADCGASHEQGVCVGGEYSAGHRSLAIAHPRVGLPCAANRRKRRGGLLRGRACSRGTPPSDATTRLWVSSLPCPPRTTPKIRKCPTGRACPQSSSSSHHQHRTRHTPIAGCPPSNSICALDETTTEPRVD